MTLLPCIASAYNDTHPQTELSADTLHQSELKLGLGRFEAGVTEDFMLTLEPLLLFLRVKNIQGKYRFVHASDISASVGTGLFWFNLQDFDDDAEDVDFYCFPLQISATWRESSDYRYHGTLSYTAITSQGNVTGEDGNSVKGVGVVETAVFHPTWEVVVDRELSLLVDASILLFQRVKGNGSYVQQINEYTTLEVHPSGEADLKTGFQAFLAVGALWSWEHFNMRALAGYGNYPIPVVNFFFPTRIPMVDFDVYWRF